MRQQFSGWMRSRVAFIRPTETRKKPRSVRLSLYFSGSSTGVGKISLCSGMWSILPMEAKGTRVLGSQGLPGYQGSEGQTARGKAVAGAGGKKSFAPGSFPVQKTHQPLQASSPLGWPRVQLPQHGPQNQYVSRGSTPAPCWSWQEKTTLGGGGLGKGLPTQAAKVTLHARGCTRVTSSFSGPQACGGKGGTSVHGGFLQPGQSLWLCTTSWNNTSSTPTSACIVIWRGSLFCAPPGLLLGEGKGGAQAGLCRSVHPRGDIVTQFTRG